MAPDVLVDGLADDKEDDGNDAPPEQPLQDSELRDVHVGLTNPRAPRDFQAQWKRFTGAPAQRNCSIIRDRNSSSTLGLWPNLQFASNRSTRRGYRAPMSNGRTAMDGYVRVDGATKSVEVTIALLPDRKMGKEYLTDSDIELDDPVEDWIARADAIPEALETAIRKKVAKRYGSGVWLVVYLNLGEYGIRQQQTELVIAQIKQKYAGAFDALFVLWKDKVY